MSRNQLDRETSPYLLQHKDNPVHWRPWGQEALAEARKLQRPLLLSVGYAACHWCHVMAHESFENAETARLMNELFVPVKVDREERPDIDAIYQAALSMLGQRGGWPLTMFLTPDGEPFWGGTYFPPKPRYGMPGFRDILTGVADAWKSQPEKIAGNVGALKEALADEARSTPGAGLDLSLLDRAAQTLLRSVDMRHGGLQGAPKFPHMPLFTLLWRAGRRNDDPELKTAVLLTLERMCQGGIYDHLGGGFARYSTDEEWLAPHFEKMLYDNAQLIDLLTEVAAETGEPLFRQRIEETVGWLLREMLAEGDAFAATLDADSEGEEGRYYVWRAHEIEDNLPSALLKPFCATYDVSSRGNWEGKVILNRSHAQPLTPRQEELMAVARAHLLKLRSSRVPPGRDDKILADWNGMMIAALARAGLVFDQPDWIAAARTAFRTVVARMQKDGRLCHSFRLGQAKGQAMLDDYAQMARAAIALYEAGGEADDLTQAEQWVAVADRYYWDADKGGYFFTASDAEDLLIRSKTASDNATPSGNGVMVEVLSRLFLLTDKPDYRDRAEQLVQAFSGQLASSFPGMASLLNGWDLLRQARMLTLSGRRDDPVWQALLRVAAEKAPPTLVLKHHRSDGPASALLCSGQVCGLPLSDVSSLIKALEEEI